MGKMSGDKYPEDKRLVFDMITEHIAYGKCYEILKNKGYLAMFRMLDDYKSTNADLYDDIQKVYDTCYEVDIPYTCKFNYKNGESYGFSYLGEYKFYGGKKLYCAGFRRVYQNQCGSDYNKRFEPGCILFRNTGCHYETWK